jgi:hypothetical protein
VRGSIGEEDDGRERPAEGGASGQVGPDRVMVNDRAIKPVRQHLRRDAGAARNLVTLSRQRELQ